MRSCRVCLVQTFASSVLRAYVGFFRVGLTVVSSVPEMLRLRKKPADSEAAATRPYLPVLWRPVWPCWSPLDVVVCCLLQASLWDTNRGREFL